MNEGIQTQFELSFFQKTENSKKKKIRARNRVIRKGITLDPLKNPDHRVKPTWPKLGDL